MGLAELQKDLRDIENQIELLNSKIEKMKPKNSDKLQEEFNEITRMAKKYPIENLGISQASELLQKEFISGLSYLICTVQTDINERLLYLCRLAGGTSVPVSAEDIYKSGLEWKIEDIERMCEDLDDYKYSFLVEAFIIANLSGNVSEEMLSFIADIASLMKLDKNDIRISAQIAKSKLLNDTSVLDELSWMKENRWSGMFDDYIPEEWFIANRQQCACVHLDEYGKKGLIFFNTISKKDIVKYTLSSSDIVNKDDKVFSYLTQKITSSRTENGDIKNVCAPKSGMICYVENRKKVETEFSEEIKKEYRLEEDDLKGILGISENELEKFMTVYIVSPLDDINKIVKWDESQTYRRKISNENI